jgi:hypothetical protein
MRGISPCRCCKFVPLHWIKVVELYFAAAGRRDWERCESDVKLAVGFQSRFQRDFGSIPAFSSIALL